MGTQVPQFNRGTQVQVLPRFRWFDATLLTAAAVISLGAMAALVFAPRNESSGVAVIFAPWTTGHDTLSRTSEAGSRFIRFGAFEFIAVVQPDNERFAQDIRAQGAWFIADPSALAACLKPFARSKV